MTTEAINDLIQKLATDEVFLTEFETAFGDNEGEEAIQAVVKFATSRGYSVTAGEIDAARNDILQQLEGNEGDIGDEELDQVSGGNWVTHVNNNVVFQKTALPAAMGIGKVAGKSMEIGGIGEKTVGASQNVSNFFKKW